MLLGKPNIDYLQIILHLDCRYLLGKVLVLMNLMDSSNLLSTVNHLNYRCLKRNSIQRDKLNRV